MMLKKSTGVIVPRNANGSMKFDSHFSYRRVR